MRAQGRQDEVACSPEWFRSALAAGPERLVTRVNGSRIHWRGWGDPAHPLVLLVHGAAGLGGWWDHVAPYLAVDRHVVALDLSGHGSSDHRKAYDLEGWADEVAGVARAATDRSTAAGTVLVGHCMGGYVALEAARRLEGDEVDTIVVEAPFTPEPPEWTAAGEARAARGARIHGTRRAAREHFKPAGGAATLDYVVDHLSRLSVRSCAGGWRLRVDPKVFAHGIRPERVALPAGRVAVFRGEHGIVDLEHTREHCRPGVPITTLPDSGHHPMLDQPLALVTGLRTRLDDWATAP